MVIKLGLDQLPRGHFKFGWYDEQWISMDHVNNGPPTEDKILQGDERWNFGFNDFVLAEITPSYAYQVKGQFQDSAVGPPEHPRAYRGSTAELVEEYMLRGLTYYGKSRTGYRTMAYGWGNHRNILDQDSTKNYYVDIEGPPPGEMTGEPFVYFVPLPIPGGLTQHDTFWIDLNKGVRALYFPARYIWNMDSLGDAAYAKISFVEETERNLIDASSLFFEQMLAKFVDGNIDLTGKTRENSETAKLVTEVHIGAYSLSKTLMVNIPQFVEACFMLYTDPNVKPHDSIYLADSADIKATRFHAEGWHLPPGEGFFPWWVIQRIQKTYAGELSRSEQINLTESQTSDLGAGGKLGLTVLVMALSLMPYIGPVLAVAGDQLIESLDEVKTTSEEDELDRAKINKNVWEATPDEVKDGFVKRLQKELPKVVRKLRKLRR